MNLKLKKKMIIIACLFAYFSCLLIFIASINIFEKVSDKPSPTVDPLRPTVGSLHIK